MIRATGYDVNNLSNNIYFKSNYNGSNSGLSSDWSSNSDSDYAFMSSTTYDHQAFNLSTQVEHKLNAESLSISLNLETFWQTLKKQTTGLGIGGGWANDNSNNFFSGDIAEIILFDRKLTTSELKAIEDKILVDYSIVPICTTPADTTGYDVSSCDTSGGAISELSCALSCASGYVDTGASPSCETTGGTFSFSGCVPIINFGTTYDSCSSGLTATSDQTGYYTIDSDGVALTW